MGQGSNRPGPSISDAEIKKLARGLKCDPDLMYKFVHDYIHECTVEDPNYVVGEIQLTAALVGDLILKQGFTFTAPDTIIHASADSCRPTRSDTAMG